MTNRPLTAYIDDLVLRLAEIRDELAAAQDEVSRLMVERSNRIEEALASGLGPSAIARALEISTQRLAQLRKPQA